MGITIPLCTEVLEKWMEKSGWEQNLKVKFGRHVASCPLGPYRGRVTLSAWPQEENPRPHVKICLWLGREPGSSTSQVWSLSVKPLRVSSWGYERGPVSRGGEGEGAGLGGLGRACAAAVIIKEHRRWREGARNIWMAITSGRGGRAQSQSHRNLEGLRGTRRSWGPPTPSMSWQGGRAGGAALPGVALCQGCSQ